MTGSSKSDASIVRRTALAAGLAALAALVLVVVIRPAASPGPLGRPHVLAALRCDDCHDRPGQAAPSTACTRCHGVHGSTRAGHRAASARGELDCATCHPAHAAAEGVTFDAQGGAIRWRGDEEERVPGHGPPGATVPLVALAACQRCHDADRPDDPLQAYRAPAASRGGFAFAFDEHGPVASTLSPSSRRTSPSTLAVCDRQHTPSRFVAWDAARAVAESSIAPEAHALRGSAPWTLGGIALGVAAIAAGALVRRTRAVRSSQGLPPRAPERARLPVIDAGSCLGCRACVDACPFDVLAVDRHLAVVARPSECCGVGVCADVCPNGSLRLVDGSRSTLQRPRVDEHLESVDAPGVFVAGDLTGVPLIRSAIAQGAAVADRVASTLSGGRRAKGASVDLVVIGAGPAGLSAALRAKELGLACVVLEQSTLAASIRAFPRGKVVHDAPIALPLEGSLWMNECTKEELLAQWTRIVRTHRLAVREGHRATGVARAGDLLRVAVETQDGPTSIDAARVVIAIGRRGTPRPLGVPIAPGAAPRVLSGLSDARAFAGRRVVVVGLGDSALEAVIALARQPGTRVVVSYRGAGFARGRGRNVDSVRKLAEGGRIRIVFGSEVVRVDERRLLLRSAAGEEEIAFDAILALLGGLPSRGLLDAAGVTFVAE